ncbi:MAG: hypothetical protein EAZ08_11325 [Cytophagales bacterium]|nr:MAG: hypothetical protein EAZ08_11325 [Cytophagales bacterium]
MRQFTLQLLVTLLILVLGCGTDKTQDNEAMADISFEDFIALFPQFSGIKEINADNGEEFKESPEIEAIYFQNFLQGKTYLNQLSEKLQFNQNTTDNQEITYRVVGQLSLDTHFYSLLVSANSEGDPTHKWAYYLLNYTKEGSYIDGILLSYRHSYLSEETLQEIAQSEYRYVSFLPKNQLYFVDVNYDNTLQSNAANNDASFLLTAAGDKATQYFRESCYQIEANGIFKQLKVVERNKNEAKP